MSETTEAARELAQGLTLLVISASIGYLVAMVRNALDERRERRRIARIMSAGSPHAE